MSYSAKKTKVVKSRVTTEEYFVNPPSPIPYDLSVRTAFDIENAMLRNEFLVGCLFFPRVEASLQSSLESIFISNDIIGRIKRFVPNDTIDDVFSPELATR